MSTREIVKQLEQLGSESYRNVLRRHGVSGPLFGVKIADLKKIEKRVKCDHPLALDLYDTGIYDAMYLAGLIAEPQKMTKKDLRRWLDNAGSAALCDYTVPWVTAESRFGRELAMEWIESKDENVAAAGWATLSSLVAIKDDSELDLAELKRLLGRVQKTIHRSPNRVRYLMNGFVIAVGCHVAALTEAALEAARKIGVVSVDMGDTACEVPDAGEYIRKVQKRGSLGKKRKKARC